MIIIWRYWTIRPNAPLVGAPVALVPLALQHFAWTQQAFSFSAAFGQTVALMLLCVLPQAWLCRRNSAAALVAEEYSVFLSEVLCALGMGLLTIAPLFWFFPKFFPGPGIALAVLAVSALALICLRPSLQWMLRHRKFGERLLVLGSGEMASRFCDELAITKATTAEGNSDGRPTSLAPVQEHSSSGTAVTFEQLREITRRDGISRIVLAEPVHNSKALAFAILDCKLQGLEVEQAAESYEKFSGKVWLEGVRPDWLVYSYGFQPPKYYLQLKRVLDILCAFILLIVAAPLLAFAAVAVKLDSKGKVLFRQERVGWHGKPFVLLKFRTMCDDAEQASGPVWSGIDDPRITKVGRWLRRFRIDELPQLFNVVRGEMGLVGPRPERPHFVRLLNDSIPYYDLRHCVKPGITGWAQVLYPYGSSVEDAYEKMQYDLYYAKHMSLGFDLRVLIRTVLVVLFGRGR